jgi:hypothetical protein
VNTSNFSVTLSSGSSFSVSSPTFQQLSSDVQSDVTNNTCTGSASSISLAYSGAGTVTNVITPSAKVCSGSSDRLPRPSYARRNQYPITAEAETHSFGAPRIAIIIPLRLSACCPRTVLGHAPPRAS